MKIGRPTALLIGLVTAWPIVYMVLFFASMFAGVAPGSEATDLPVFGGFETLMAFHLATMVAMLAVVVFYVVHAFKNDALGSEKRILWVIVLLLGGSFAAPIYWFHYVWRSPQEANRAPRGSSEG